MPSPYLPVSGASVALSGSRFRGVAFPAVIVLVLGLLGGGAWLGVSSEIPSWMAVLGLAATSAAVSLGALLYAWSCARQNAVEREIAETSRLALQAALPQLQAVWEKAPLGIVLLDPADPEFPFRIVDCNPLACEMHGYSRAELIGQSIDFIEQVPWTHNAPKFLAELRNVGRIDGESRHKRKDGTVFPVIYSTNLIVVNGRELVLGMDRDSTVRKNMEQALHASEERWTLAVNGSNEGVWDWDLEKDTMWFSPRSKILLGYPDEKLPNRLMVWIDRVHPDDRAKLQSTLKAHMARETEVFMCEYRIVQPDGSWNWVLARGQAIFGPDNRATRMVGTHTDITQQKKIEIELRQAKDAAESADRAKSEFLAVMSHEIRTPMNGVLGFTNLLLDTQLGDEQRDWLLSIRSSGETLLSLINDILDFSKIESGHMEPEQQPVSVQRCIEEVLDLLWSKASEKKIELLHWVEGDVPEWIISDSIRLRQILINLVANAIKFTAHGEVEVRASMAPPVADHPPQLVILIRDTGEGIPEDRIGRLFRPFSQADSSTTRRFGGTGLGLAISRNLAELLGGDIELVSTSPQGSCFRFTLQAPPAAAPEEAGASAQSSGSIAAFEGRHAVIIDDNEANRRILVGQLKRWGLVCHAFRFPLDAIQFAASNQVDVALLDMMMPKMNGVEVAQEMHRQFGLEKFPLILLSSVSKEELRAFRPEEHFKVVLTKPLRTGTLLEGLQAAFDKKRPATAVPYSGVAAPNPDDILAQRHPLRILVAEDNLVNQKLISGLLRRLGYTSKIVPDGVACLEALRRDPYDLVLMDCQMPEMDGYEATRHIRRGEAGERHRWVRIIALTASAMVGDRERCLGAGMNEYLTKPIQAANLTRMIEESPALP